MANNFESLLGNTIREQLTQLIPEITLAVAQTVLSIIKETNPKEEAQLSTADVCKLFNIHPVTANRWRRNGLLPYHTTPGRKVYYLRSEIIKSFEQNSSKRRYITN